MSKTKVPKTATRRYDVAEHLRTPEEVALYLSACIDESEGDLTFVVKAIDDIARAKRMAASPTARREFP